MFRAQLFRVKTHLFYALIVVLLLYHKVLIGLMSFKNIVKWYSHSKGRFSNRALNKRQILITQKLLLRASGQLFWRPNCFEKALTTMLISKLMHWPCLVHFGIQKDGEGGLKAHAWSTVDAFEMSGHDVKQAYVSVYQMQYTP